MSTSARARRMVGDVAVAEHAIEDAASPGSSHEDTGPDIFHDCGKIPRRVLAVQTTVGDWLQLVRGEYQIVRSRSGDRTGCRQGKPDGDDGPSARRAFDGHVAVVGLDESLDGGEAEARTA